MSVPENGSGGSGFGSWENFQDRQVADLDVVDLVFFGPGTPVCAADTLCLWGGVSHTFGLVSKHVGSFLGADRAL